MFIRYQMLNTDLEDELRVQFHNLLNHPSQELAGVRASFLQFGHESSRSHADKLQEFLLEKILFIFI